MSDPSADGGRSHSELLLLPQHERRDSSGDLSPPRSPETRASAVSRDNFDGTDSPPLCSPSEQQPPATSSSSPAAAAAAAAPSSASASRRYLPPAMLDFFTPSKEKRTRAARPEKTEATIIDLSQARNFPSPRNGSGGGGSAGRGGSSSSSPARASSGSGGNGFAGSKAGDMIIGEMRGIIGSVNFLKHYISKTAKLFCVLVLISAIVPISTAIAVLVSTYWHEQRLLIDDLSACDGQTYADIKTNDVGYNLANIIVAACYMSWMAARAVRLEKEGLMVTFAIISVAHMARLGYFSFDVAYTSITQEATLAAIQVLNTISIAVLIGALLLSVKVYQGFGWRLYSKGVTAAQDVRQMRRYKQFDACLKLDIFVCLVTFISIFFLVSNNTARIIGFVIMIVTLLSLSSITHFIRKNAAIVVYTFFCVCVLMPSFYAYVVADLLGADDKVCDKEVLGGCLQPFNMTATTDPPTPSTTTGDGLVVVNASSGYFWVMRNCDAENGATCINELRSAVSQCCNEYGQCERKQVFRRHDRVVMIVIAAIGFTLRIATIGLGYFQLRAMNLPSVRELFKRGERNLRSISFTAFFAKRGDGEKLDTLIDPDDRGSSEGASSNYIISS